MNNVSLTGRLALLLIASILATFVLLSFIIAATKSRILPCISSHAARPYMTVANEKAHEKVVEAQRSIWESETGE